jgi:hypothetical protein
MVDRRVLFPMHIGMQQYSRRTARWTKSRTGTSPGCSSTDRSAGELATGELSAVYGGVTECSGRGRTGLDRDLPWMVAGDVLFSGDCDKVAAAARARRPRHKDGSNIPLRLG